MELLLILDQYVREFVLAHLLVMPSSMGQQLRDDLLLTDQLAVVLKAPHLDPP